MAKCPPTLLGSRLDVCTLEADMAFFEARLSLAGQTPDTVYQRAQIKTYQALGQVLGETLKTLKPPPETGPAGDADRQSTA